MTFILAFPYMYIMYFDHITERIFIYLLWGNYLMAQGKTYMKQADHK
jgi:hypothetical protein